ncbi:uncharacterized protein METZ01_LOCUS184782, partial [marine metagenome]
VRIQHKKCVLKPIQKYFFDQGSHAAFLIQNLIQHSRILTNNVRF